MLSDRQSELLKLIVEDYIKTARPVSSTALCEIMNCSSATVRNEMVALEDSGLIEKNNIAKTLEGRVVKYSDKIAYINHDIDDSIRAGLLHEEELPKEAIKVLGDNHSERVQRLVTDMVNQTQKNLATGIYNIKQSDEVKEAMIEIRKYMLTINWLEFLGNILLTLALVLSFVTAGIYEGSVTFPLKLVLITLALYATGAILSNTLTILRIIFNPRARAKFYKDVAYVLGQLISVLSTLIVGLILVLFITSIFIF